MGTIMPYSNGESPFDALKRIDSRGDHWTARDLMSRFAYSRWVDVRKGIGRARVAITNTLGEAAGQPHIEDVLRRVDLGNGAQREVDDFRLTRFGAYMWAINGDPRKPEVAAAQAYFAVQTRIAETMTNPAPVPITTDGPWYTMPPVSSTEPEAWRDILDAAARLSQHEQGMHYYIQELARTYGVPQAEVSDALADLTEIFEHTEMLYTRLRVATSRRCGIGSVILNVPPR